MHELSSGLWLGQDDEACDDASWWVNSQPGADVGIPANVFLRQCQRSKGLKKAALGVAAFFLIAGVFTAFCKKLRSRVTEAGSPRRRLAEGGGEDGEDDDELQAILEDCLDLEEETKLLASSDVPPPHTGPSSSAATWDGAALTGALWPTSSSHWPFTLPLPTQESSPSGSSQPLLFPSDEGIRHQLRPAEGDTLEETPFQKDGWSPAQPQLEPGAWLEQIPDITSSEATAFLAGPETQASPGDETQPSTSAAAEQDLSTTTPKSNEFADHPYVQRPRLQPGVVPRRIKLSGLIAAPHNVNGSSSFQILSAMRRVLAKPELGAADAELLLQLAELAVAFVRHRINPQVGLRQISDLVIRLGVYFLLLEAIFTASEILGPAMHIETWWQEFTDHFKIDYPEFDSDEAEVKERRASTYNFRLLSRIQKALRCFKEGRRPQDEEVVAIKRSLFFSSTVYFRRSHWEPWRQDDRNYRSEKGKLEQTTTPR